MVEIWNLVITILLDRLASTAVLVRPAGCEGAGAMRYTQKLRDFPPYRITRAGLIATAPAGNPRERSFHFEGELPGLDLKWLGLRNYKRLVLRDREWLALSDSNL